MLSQRTLCLVLANLLLPMAILLFAKGFFPYKPFLPGLARYDDIDAPAAPFNKVIFMVVDALRSDFVFGHGSGFEFTHRLINKGVALPFTAHATSPTITMPRVKALTTGSIPSFLDVILNFAEADKTSTLAHQDTWLAQMRAKGQGKSVMYGDDTWLKLFPETFSRADGTSSFFVSDFTEVDNNVTRHVPYELQQEDWNTLVMHYLGLDHIGHKAGPRSPNMLPKQREMDGIVQQMYNAMESSYHLSSTLLVLCGDHGMNDAGNHGGSSPGETSTALVFISPRLTEYSKGITCPTHPQGEFEFYRTIEQSDVVPTLAGLLGFPIPKNNLGVFIPEMLQLWKDDDDRVQLLLQNARQVLRIIDATGSSFEQRSAQVSCPDSTTDLNELACDWQLVSRFLDARSADVATDVKQLLSALTKFARRAQNILSGAASNYDLSIIGYGTALAAISMMLALVACFPILSGLTTSVYVFLGITLTYGVMMFASSYIEEEHHFWYWTTSGWLLYLFKKRGPSLQTRPFFSAASFLLVMSALRITRRWNQTGQKLAGASDIARTFFHSHPELLWIAVIATYVNVIQRTCRRRHVQALSIEAGPFLSIAVGCTAFWFKAAYTIAEAPELLQGLPTLVSRQLEATPLLVLARMVFLGLFVCWVYHLATAWNTPPSTTRVPKREALLKTTHDLLTLLLMTQSRATNIPLFLIFDVQLWTLQTLGLSHLDVAITSLLLQHVSFFALGGSNSISSIDLSNAYNGVGGYNVAVVGLLTFVGNWAGPIWWVSGGVSLLSSRHVRREKGSRPSAAGSGSGEASEDEQGDAMGLREFIYVQTLFTTTSLVFVMLACTALRTHLFIWTVFSPKYLYSMAWSVGQHLGVNIGFAALLWWLAGLGGS